MRQTLRRSCAACAKSKHSCDLQVPRCARCSKRKLRCVYANEPLSAPSRESSNYNQIPWEHEPVDLRTFTSLGSGILDPFESYPPTRLSRNHTQRLIHSFLQKIAFQYYPLDLNTASNPFLVSWWPLALGDPALFHVSLQTASLDEELFAQRGFYTSELLMADSVALLRRKVENPLMALQDGTLNSVITLAAIEFGKGNTVASEMHVSGVKKLVELKGGINSVRQTSPLTARMVSWVSMIVTGQPQFGAQDDAGHGDGVPPISEWLIDTNSMKHDMSALTRLGLSEGIASVLVRLQKVCHSSRTKPLPPTQLHDLACYVIHRLLLMNSLDGPPTPASAAISESFRLAIVLYMFIAQGPTYYSHTVIMHSVATRLKQALEQSEDFWRLKISEGIWLVAVGLVATDGHFDYLWFKEKADSLIVGLGVNDWDQVMMSLRSVLWFETDVGERTFRAHWRTAEATMPSSNTRYLHDEYR